VAGDLRSSDLVTTIEGDMTHLDTVLTTPHHLLEETAGQLPPLVVTRRALVRVIESLMRGETPPDRAQRWASFVRRGYAPQSRGTPIKPLEIVYDPHDEDCIVQVVSRLDEIGDTVNGVVTRAELEELKNLILGGHRL